MANLAPVANLAPMVLLLLLFEFFLDLFDIDGLHNGLEVLILQGGPAARCFGFVLTVLALESCNRHGVYF